MQIQCESAEVWTNLDVSNIRSFRQALGNFATGVTVVATRAPDGRVRSFTANSFSSVSLDPPLILVCQAKSSPAADVFRSASQFSISVLERSQRDIANACASRDPEVKREAEKSYFEGDVPSIPQSLATFICNRHEVLDGGDHLILLGRVTRMRSVDGEPLGFFRGSYVGIDGNKPIELYSPSTMVGGILTARGQTLLCRKPGGNSWEIPTAELAADTGFSNAISDLFGQFGIETGVAVPFSIFRDAITRRPNVVFSVQSTGEFPVGLKDSGVELALWGAHEIPWALVADPMHAALLRRHLHERSKGVSGVYLDHAEEGQVFAIDPKSMTWADWISSPAV